MAQKSNSQKKSNWKGKGKKPKKDFDKRDSIMEEDRGRTERIGPRNDFSWYNHNPQLTQAVAQIPFPYRPGMSLQVAKKAFDTSATPMSLSIPGIMALSWAPTIGSTSTPTDPASIAAKEIFAKVREAFSGSIDADAPDFVIYLMALDSVFSYIGSLKRVYRILNAYSPLNFNTPDLLLQSLGISSSDIVYLKQHRMEFYQIINELVGMTTKFRCPAVFDLFNRHYWLNDNVYTDDPSANSQFYVFVQRWYYQYALQNIPGSDPVKQAGGLSVVKSPWYSTPSTGQSILDVVFTFGRDLIDALASSDDAYIISGYLMRAFQGAAMFAVDTLNIDEQFTPVYEPEVLTQIENSMTIGKFNESYAVPPVAQDPATNALVCNLQIQLPKTDGLYEIQPTLSLRSDLPSVSDVVIASRLQANVYPISQGVSPVTTNTWGLVVATEIPLFWELWYLDYQSVVHTITLDQKQQFSSTAQGSTYSQYMVAMSYVSQFDWHPKFYCSIDVGPGVPGKSINLFCDVHNVTVFSRHQLENIHRICLYSEFNSFGQI